MANIRPNVDRKEFKVIGVILVMINLYVKFNVNCSYAEQVIVLKVADRRTDGRTRLVTTIGIHQYFGRGLKTNVKLDHIM